MWRGRVQRRELVALECFRLSPPARAAASNLSIIIADVLPATGDGLRDRLLKFYQITAILCAVNKIGFAEIDNIRIIGVLLQCNKY